MTLLPKKRPTWIPVVAAMMLKDSRVLLGQRPEGSSFAGVWEFPGGKIEPHESPEMALKRELNEELGIVAEVKELCIASSHTYGDVNILLMIYKVQYWTGEPRTLHHNDLKWVELSDVHNYDLPEANKKIVQQLISRV